MPRRRELPRDFSTNVRTVGAHTDAAFSFDFDDADNPDLLYVAGSSQQPINEYDALMRCAPCEEAVESIEDRLPLRDVVADAIDGLDEQDRWIFEALFIRRLSIRQLAAEIALPKSTVHRWKDRLLGKLREKLENEPLIIEYLERGTHE